MPLEKSNNRDGRARKVWFWHFDLWEENPSC
jgi:hypothetical protein